MKMKILTPALKTEFAIDRNGFCYWFTVLKYSAQDGQRRSVICEADTRNDSVTGAFQLLRFSIAAHLRITTKGK